MWRLEEPASPRSRENVREIGDDAQYYQLVRRGKAPQAAPPVVAFYLNTNILFVFLNTEKCLGAETFASGQGVSPEIIFALTPCDNGRTRKVSKSCHPRTWYVDYTPTEYEVATPLISHF